jgi:hypothetical protein
VDALRLMQYRAKSAADYGWTEKGEDLTREQDGFTLRATTEYDEGMGLDDMGLGTFDDERGDDRWSVPTGGGPSWSTAGNYKWYHPANADDLFDYYRKQGATKATAAEWTRLANQKEASYAAEAATYVVIVTVSKAGVELGKATLGGVGFDTDDWDRARQLASIVDETDLVGEAMTEARDTLADLRDA